MAKNYNVCQKELSFKDSFVLEGKPICKLCLNEAQGKKTAPEPVNKQNEKPQEPQKETTGAFILTLVFSIFVPILSIWNGIEYLVHKETWKGSLLLVIFAIQLIYIISVVT